jgi:thiamine biosynthesis protein ThiS
MPPERTLPPQLHLTVNGEPRSVAIGHSVADLLRDLDIRSVAVAVERNRQVVRRAQHAETWLAEGDVIEIVQFVGGG